MGKLTREQMMLISVMEECNELSQVIAKSLRFGLRDNEPGEHKTNAQRIMEEFGDIMGAMSAACNANPELGIASMNFDMDEAIVQKLLKLDRWFEYSKNQGTAE